MADILVVLLGMGILLLIVLIVLLLVLGMRSGRAPEPRHDHSKDIVAIKEHMDEPPAAPKKARGKAKQ